MTKSSSKRSQKAVLRSFNQSTIILFALSLSFVLSPLMAAAAPPASQFALGLQAYKARRFNEAVTYFYNAITNEKAGPAAYLYMGHSYLGAGDRAKAEQTYRSIQKSTYKYSKEAIAANQGLAMLRITNPTNRGTAAVGSVGSLTSPNVTLGRVGSPAQVDRITIQPPRAGRPDVTPAAIAAVRAAFEGLPMAFKNTLVGGGVTVVLTPAMIDKFPEGAYKERSGYDGATDKSCDGLCVNRTIVLAEHKINERTNEIGPAISTSVIEETFFHESGHAYDNCVGGSGTAAFKAAYAADSAKLDDATTDRLAYFMQKNGSGARETFAELTSYLLGNRRWSATDVATNFPASLKVVKEAVSL